MLDTGNNIAGRFFVFFAKLASTGNCELEESPISPPAPPAEWSEVNGRPP